MEYKIKVNLKINVCLWNKTIKFHTFFLICKNTEKYVKFCTAEYF
jgi:hypothetical protein